MYDYENLKALQIVDGNAEIYYFADEERLIVQIRELINKSSHNLVDFRVTIILIKYGQVFKTLNGPKFNINALDSTSYNKEFIFKLVFDDLPSSSLIVQIQGKLDSNNRKSRIVASRAFIQLGNFDIIYSSRDKQLLNKNNHQDKIVSNNNQNNHMTMIVNNDNNKSVTPHVDDDNDDDSSINHNTEDMFNNLDMLH